MATSGVYKLAREAGLTPTQQEVEKGRVQISLSSHCCLKDHPIGLTVGHLAATRLKKGEFSATAAAAAAAAAAADDDDDDDAVVAAVAVVHCF